MQEDKVDSVTPTHDGGVVTVLSFNSQITSCTVASLRITGGKLVIESQ